MFAVDRTANNLAPPRFQPGGFSRLFLLLTMAAVAVLAGCGDRRDSAPAPVAEHLRHGEPLPAEFTEDLERYITRTMKKLDVPGASVVLVHQGKIIFREGFGVRDELNSEPVTPETLMSIGSSTKTLSALMVASLVDDGYLDWSTPMVAVRPSFTLAEPDITEAVTLQHTFCMCSGVPRAMDELAVRYEEMTAEDVIASLADIPLSGDLGQDFNYSSRMLASGAYLAALAAGGQETDLYTAYVNLMQERVFNPMGMTASTFSIDRVTASADYATPHTPDLDSGYLAIPPEIEGIFTPIAPAGALWSSARDMGSYLITLLNGGLTPDGIQVVSSKNLGYLWEPQVEIDAQASYGLGWYIESYHGLTVLHHPGGTAGFASELVILPELELGFALLSNRMDLVTPFGRAVTYRLLEMLTGREAGYEAEILETAGDIKRQVTLLRFLSSKKADRQAVEPYLGAYQNDTLGVATLLLHDDGSLWVDFGEYESATRRLRLEDNQYIFTVGPFIGKSLTLVSGPAGARSMTINGNEQDYHFEASD